MKGIHALILALGLGMAAALFNWAYLTQQTGDAKTEIFLGIARDATVSRGETLREDQLAEVEIPAPYVRNLKQYAFLYRERSTVVGMKVVRTLEGGSLVLRDDLRTPAADLQFGLQNPKPGVEECVIWIPVDVRTFVPSLVEPGDRVSFVVSQARVTLPTRADEVDPEALEPGALEPPPQPTGPVEIIGPFTVLALGNRLGETDVLRAAKVPQLQENVMAISVRLENGKLEKKAEKLWQLLEATGFRQVGIMLHSRQTASN